jgi:hypothetical protein
MLELAFLLTTGLVLYQFGVRATAWYINEAGTPPSKSRRG